MTIEELTEAAEAGFIPEDPAGLHATMEGLPGFVTRVADGLGAFGEWLSGSVGETTGLAVTELAQLIKAAEDKAAEACAAYQDESAAWRET